MYGGTAGTGRLCVAHGGARCEADQHLKERKYHKEKEGGHEDDEQSCDWK